MPGYQIVRSSEQIDEALNEATEGVDQGTKWPGLSYEEGVVNAINWLLGFTNVNPIEK